MRGKRSVGLLTAVIAMTLVGCGGGDTNGSSGGTGGSGGQAGSTATGSAGTGGTDGGGGSGGSIDPALFAGADVSGEPDGQAPQGCEGQADAVTGELALAFGQGLSTVLIGVVGGTIHANGVACSFADGAPATTDKIAKITLAGTAADETAILDLATGPFGEHVYSGGIHVTLGDGKDTFVLRGSLGDDVMKAGAEGDEIGFDPDDHGGADILVGGAESIAMSFGPGKDSFSGTGIAGGAPAPLRLALFGDDGDDALQGGNGDDALHGGAGDDTFRTAAAPDGADLYDGGEGVDTLDYSARTAALKITMGAGADDGEQGENDDAQGSIERLLCGSGDDQVTGSAASEEIHGGPGKDVIHGGEGSDALNGEAGDDSLFGDDGDDNLFGDDGADHLDGGPGSDVLDGGDGKDIYDGGDGDGDVCVVDAIEEPASCELF